MRVELGWLRSRVSRRLFGLFLLAGLLPVAVCAWVATTAVTDLVDRSTQRAVNHTTRQTAMQVFDRLVAAKRVLATWPADAAPAAGTSLPPVMPGFGSMFQRVVHLDAAGRPLWSAGIAGDLVAEWRAADTARSRVSLGSAADIPVHLRVLPTQAGQMARVVLSVGARDAPHWLVEVRADYLWEPLVNEAVSSGWRVADASGLPLRLQGETPLVPAADALPDATTGQTSVFLGAEFGAGDWVFLRRQTAVSTDLFGLPLSRWLGLVALGSVLMVAALSVGQIRRMLVPLEQLTDGTRRLAQGDVGARVMVNGHDEFADLAMAFNDMAGRIDAQFHSLDALASIDRDILGGVSIDHVVERVLGQLASAYPGAVAAVAWLSGPALTELVCMRASPGQPGASPRFRLCPPVALTPAQWRMFSALATDTLQARRAQPRQPWCRTVRGAGVQQLAMLPLRWIESTRALLMLGLPQPVGLDGLQGAAEMRDRLAVAFAARERENELMHRAVHDSLTGLANRHGLQDRLDALLAPDEGPAPVACAVLFVDLDHFKNVNDSLGHEAGDELLRLAAERLQACAGPGALVARPGGDEFVLVLPRADEAQACAVAADAVRRLTLPFTLRGSDHVLGARVGVALSPGHGRSREELLRHADLAMYDAKKKGRGRYAVFEAPLDAQARQRLGLLAELRRALAEGELVAHYQPRVRPGDGAVTSAEALVRWQHPERGLLMPGAFIALAEESDLIEAIGTRMLDLACAQIAQWQRDGVGLARVSVNVSPRQLASGRLLSQVRAALTTHGVAPEALELEVTESLLVGDAREAFAQLSELRRWGVTIALDDFGTGYSSMATLRQLPIDVMKIDRAFVKDLGQEDGALAVTHAIVAMARALGLHLVAEGIETEAQAQVLRELGCDEFQGFLYSKALPPKDFERLAGLPKAPVVRRRAGAESLVSGPVPANA